MYLKVELKRMCLLRATSCFQIKLYLHNLLMTNQNAHNKFVSNKVYVTCNKIEVNACNSVVVLYTNTCCTAFVVK